MRKINVAVIGLGTIGGGVCKQLLLKRKDFKSKLGVDINLSKVFDINKSLYKQLKFKKNILAKDVDSILIDKSIDIVVELIGGINPAKSIILKALKKGKHVVTANKALLADSGKELFDAALKNNVSIKFEASVCGAIPVIKVLSESFAANDIKAFYGIVNGTCNYISTKMMRDGFSFKDALKDAQDRGFAEANPKFDIEGYDAAHKLSILSMLAFGNFAQEKDIYIEGIKSLELRDFIYAREWGYNIKLLAIAKNKTSGIELRVHPTLIPLKHMLSAVKNEDNALFIKGDIAEDSMVYGKGAGRYPTASSVLADICDIARTSSISDRDKAMYERVQKKATYKIKKIGDLISKYYVRFSTADQSGVLAKISSILADHKISIATVKQANRCEGKGVPIVMLTHEAKESEMNKALNKINRLSLSKKKPVKIRIER